MTKEERISAYKKLFNDANFSIPIYPAELDKLGYFTAPASTKYHGAYEGGLFDHQYAVTKILLEYTEKLGLRWEKPRSPYIVGMFHDFCKCGLYKPKEDEYGYDFNDDLVIPGHADRSVIMLQQFINLTFEEVACIRWHMGAYETDTSLWKYYGRAVSAYPNVLYTHTADMAASKILRV